MHGLWMLLGRRFGHVGSGSGPRCREGADSEGLQRKFAQADTLKETKSLGETLDTLQDPNP